MSSAVAAATRPVRAGWRRLTSMRTALILLFLLAVGAVPGSLLPQRPLNPSSTSSYIKDHGAWGRFLNSIGMFDVFGSIWFSAIYLLLFVSLIGCLVPRIRVHAKAVVRAPLPAPRVLGRLPESAHFETRVGPDDYAASARAVLGRRWRVAQRTEDSGAVTLSAEKGYSRETGNLIFHVALLVALVLIAIGRLYSYEGTVVVQQGNGFCNNIGQFDSWKPGRFAAEGKISPAPFCINDVKKFVATYSSDGEPRNFAAHIVYQRTLTAEKQRATIKVNHPLRLEGDRVYLTGHGFAPSVTIRMPDGSVRHDTEVFLPTNGSTLFSEGVFEQPGADGARQDVGIQGFFAPSPIDQGNGVIASSSARVDHPVLGITVFTGDLNRTGQPRSVYSLDTSKMKQIGRANLEIGQTKIFPNGARVTFDGWNPYVNLQVSHDPAQGYLLFAALAMVLGLAASLGVRRRRLWIRIGPATTDDSSGPTLVRVGGLARSDSGNFTTEFAALVTRLDEAGSLRPDQISDGSHDTLDDQRRDSAIGAGKD